MVKGLEIFKGHFAGYETQYLLIGGTAASLVFGQANLSFRATKDLDIVLIVEALDAAFASRFWQFIEAGGYEIRQANETGRPIFYRFQKPTEPRFPAMLELFSRAPEGLQLAPNSHLAPIPVDEAVSSLSAILLNETYYTFLLEGRRILDGLPFIGEDRLIPLKASAWLDLVQRKAVGEAVDAKAIRKHANDVLRLSQLFAPTTTLALPEPIAQELRRFLSAVAQEGTLNPSDLGIRAPLQTVLERIAASYGLNQP